eukprot:gene39800-53821_t
MPSGPDDQSFISPAMPSRLPRPRSADWGGKALLVCALALLMTIPGLFVWALIKDRSDRSEGVVREVSQLQGGAQQITGPLLVAPWTVTPTTKDGEVLTGWYLVSPDTGAADVKVKTGTLRRGIFDVPTYKATAPVGRPGTGLSLLKTVQGLPTGAVIDWSRAQIVLGFSDLRGAQTDVVATLTTPSGDTRLEFTPASDVRLGRPMTPPDSDGRVQPDEDLGDYGLVSAPAAALLAATEGGTIRTTLTLSGAQRLSVVPFAKSTTVMIAAAALGLIAYLVGNYVFAQYLQVHFVPGVGEVAVICGALIGAGLGFLWFNAPPAKIFMGDTGSLALGGALGAIAVATKHEIVLALIGGLVIAEL